MMEAKTFKTPSGYTVAIRPHLTYGQSLAIQETYAGNADIATGQGLTLGNMHAANKKAMEFLVESVTDPQGNPCPNVVEAIYDMPQIDGEAVREQIDAVTSQAATPKKSTTR